MAIYDLGIASLAANGEVTGVGTKWKAPLTLIRVGSTIVFKTEPVQIYTISEIISDTQINVYNPNSETVPAGTGYAILAHDGITVQGLAQDVAETLRYYQSQETEVADAVDAFNNFDAADFETKVMQVNTQHVDVVNIGSQVEDIAIQVAADKDSAASSAASASSDKDAAAASAQEAADYAASLDTTNLLRKDLNLSDVADKAKARENLQLSENDDVKFNLAKINQLTSSNIEVNTGGYSGISIITTGSNVVGSHCRFETPGDASVFYLVVRNRDNNSGQRIISFPNTGGTIALQGTSDINYKKNIESYDGMESVNNIKSMDLVTFVFKDDDKERVRRGVIAQQLEKIDPSYVKHTTEECGDDIFNDDGEKIGNTETRERVVLDSNVLLLDLICSMKVALCEIDSLKEEIKTMKDEIKSMKGE